MSTTRKIRRIHRSQEEIKRVVEGFETSNLSLSAYSRSVGVPQTSLGTWIRKSKTKTEGSMMPSSIIPVHLVEKKVPTSELFEVVLRNNRVVRIFPGFNPDALAQVLHVVEESC